MHIRFEAFRIISVFVENGSQFEVGLSAPIRANLLNTKEVFGKVGPNFFDEAKNEMVFQIATNPVLLGFIE